MLSKVRLFSSLELFMSILLSDNHLLQALVLMPHAISCPCGNLAIVTIFCSRGPEGSTTRRPGIKPADEVPRKSVL